MVVVVQVAVAQRQPEQPEQPIQGAAAVVDTTHWAGPEAQESSSSATRWWAQEPRHFLAAQSPSPAAHSVRQCAATHGDDHYGRRAKLRGHGPEDHRPAHACRWHAHGLGRTGNRKSAWRVAGTEAHADLVVLRRGSRHDRRRPLDGIRGSKPAGFGGRYPARHCVEHLGTKGRKRRRPVRGESFVDCALQCGRLECRNDPHGAALMEAAALIGILVVYAAIAETIRDIARWWSK